MKKEQERAARRRTIITWSSIVAGIVVIGLVITFVVVGNNANNVDPNAEIKGLKTYSDLPANHVTGSVDYEALYGTNPPVGGNHNATWLNCGVYNQPVPNENAVHALEHGSVWITYDPSISGADLQTLEGLTKSTKMILSPYEDLPAPVVVSAWGAQVQLTGADDPRLPIFIAKYWNSPNAPEPTAICTGGLDAPGRVS
jgi:hypothetical protein